MVRLINKKKYIKQVTDALFIFVMHIQEYFTHILLSLIILELPRVFMQCGIKNQFCVYGLPDKACM